MDSLRVKTDEAVTANDRRSAAGQPERSRVVELLRLLHRGTDGYLTLHSMSPPQASGEGQWTDLGSVRVGELGRRFDRVEAFLNRDFFVSLNSFFRAGTDHEVIGGRKRRRRHAVTGLDPALRNSESVKYLNAAWVDLDERPENATAATATEQRLRQLGRDGAFLRPSIVVLSGRGIWLLWLLRDRTRRDLPVRVGAPDSRRLVEHRQIEHAIVRRFQSLGFKADAQAIDAARAFRVSGSINARNGVRVRWELERHENGEVITYTMEEVAAAFDTPLADRSSRSRLDRPPSESMTPRECGSRNRAGGKARWRHALHDFETLRRLRGGFRQGCRNRAAFLYAVLLLANGFDAVTVAARARELGREASPHPFRWRVRQGGRAGALTSPAQGGRSVLQAHLPLPARHDCRLAEGDRRRKPAPEGLGTQFGKAAPGAGVPATRRTRARSARIASAADPRPG